MQFVYYSDRSILVYLVSFVISIISGCIFGLITKAISKSKGYYGGFGWGFFLGWIGIIVVACRPEVCYVPKKSIIIPEKKAQEEEQIQKPVAQILSDGSWQCSCGRHNATYVSSCVCGITKHQVKIGK